MVVIREMDLLLLIGELTVDGVLFRHISMYSGKCVLPQYL